METRFREGSSWLDPRLSVQQSRIHGRGLVATRTFRVGEVAIVFGGTLFSKEDIAAGKANDRTLMQADEGLWLGNTFDQPLDEDYFINHSCDPNLWLTGDANLTVRRSIPAGEEATMDYATHFADPSWAMKDACNCGSTICRKVITGRDWMLMDLQRRYDGHFSPLLKKLIAKFQGSD